MAMSSLILITSFLAILSSGVMALLPMEQSMNREIMSDIMDLRRKIMKYQMLLSSTRGTKSGNRILPAAEIGMREFGPLLGDMFPAQAPGTGASQAGSNMAQLSQSFQNLGIANPGTAPQKNAGKPSKTGSSSVKSIDKSSGTVSSPTPDAINTMMPLSNNQFSMADLLRIGPMTIGSSNDPMVAPASPNVNNKGSSKKNKGLSHQGKGPNPVNNTAKTGLSQISGPSANAGQPGMPSQQQPSLLAFRKFYIQQELCSETPSKLTTLCNTNIDCRHNMQCFSGRCCAISHAHAELLDNMLEQPGMRL